MLEKGLTVCTGSDPKVGLVPRVGRPEPTSRGNHVFHSSLAFLRALHLDLVCKVVETIVTCPLLGYH
jgi:hypothetical protein